MSKNKLCALITGAGAPGICGTIYCLRNNPDGMKVRVVGVDVKEDVVGRFLLDSCHKVPAPEHPEYIAVMLELCKSERVDIILPQTTREIICLSRHKSLFKERDIQVMVSDFSAIEIANNKWQVLKVFEKLGLSFPQYHIVRTREELVAQVHELGYPCRPVVVKPPISNGMRGFRILREKAWNLQRFLDEKPSGAEVTLENLLSIIGNDEFPELLVTEFLPGPEYSIDAFIGEHGGVAVPRRREVIRSGISFHTILEKQPRMAEQSLSAAQHIGLSYVFGFQFKFDVEGVPKVLECNPRIQGTMVASAFGGLNLIWMGVREALNYPVAVVPQQYKDASFYRFWGGVGVCGDEAHVI